MKVKINRFLYNFVIIFLCTFTIEIILRLIRSSNIFNWAIFRMLISSLILALIFTSINCLFKNDKVTKVLNCTYSFIIGFYAYLQLGFFQYLGTYISLNTGEQASKVTDYIWDFLYTIPWFYYLELIPFILLIIYYSVILKLLKKKFDYSYKEKSKGKTLKVLASLFLLCVVYYITLVAPFMKNKYQVESNLEVFLNPENQSTAVDQLGVTMFFVADINEFVFGYESSNDVKPIIKPNDNTSSTTNTRVYDDTIWNNLMKDETNKNYIQLNNYFSSRESSEKNEYTGMFKGKNIIFIMMESTNLIPFSDMTKEYFPTLNKLYNGGMTFTNFFSPRSSCSTGNNEMTAMIGLFPINNNCTANAYKDNKYPEAVFYKFRELGYSATSYHDYIDAYYSRGRIHTNMGSQNYYNAIRMGIKYNSVYQEWPSDTELFLKGLPYFIDDEHFMAFMTTVTGHQPYGVDSEYGNSNLSMFEDLDISLSLKRYLSKVYELEKGLTILLDTLEEKGKLEDTVLVLFGDHYPYYFSSKHVSSILGEEVMEYKNVERTPLIIYNAGTEGKKISTYSSVIDILPTVFNLFDIDYDSRLYLGTDIFDNSTNHMAIFIDGSWQSEKGFYNSSTGKFVSYDEENTYTDEEIVKINTDITNKLKMSALALKTDYMNYILTKINKIKETEKKEEVSSIDTIDNLSSSN